MTENIGLSVSETAKLAGAQWQSLSEEDKAPFVELARVDKIRATAQTKEYQELHPELQSSNKRKSNGKHHLSSSSGHTSNKAHKKSKSKSKRTSDSDEENDENDDENDDKNMINVINLSKSSFLKISFKMITIKLIKLIKNEN